MVAVCKNDGNHEYSQHSDMDVYSLGWPFVALFRKHYKKTSCISATNDVTQYLQVLTPCSMIGDTDIEMLMLALGISMWSV